MAAPARDFCQDIFCTNFNQNFVQNYLLTVSQKSVIIKLQKERGNKMEDKVKAWIEMEYKDQLRYGDNCSASHAVDRCYGVIMFAINNLFTDFNKELAKWWDDEMLPKFRDLEECD